MSDQKFKHFRLERDKDQIAWLYFDKAGASANTLDQEVFAELDQLLNAFDHDNQLKAVVIASGKSSGFIAGANIEKFTQLKDIEEAREFILHGQKTFTHLSNLKVPTVAMIDGFCVGGGLELVLACKYRVATTERKTRLGLPEVLLGIHPGWGGSVRLPELIGAPNALDLILSGKTVSAKAAAKLGFVDAAVPKRQLIHAAKYYALENPGAHKATFLQQITNNSAVRPIIGKIVSNKLKKKIRQNQYPAPFDALANWLKYGVDTKPALAGEAESLSKLVLNDTAKNLVRVFFLQERMKGLAKESDMKFSRVHVIGAGVMGGDIAAWCALSGMHVTLQDREAKFIAPAIKRAYKLFKEKLKEPREIQAAMDRLLPDVSGEGVKRADVIIEAIFENLQAKQELFKSLEKNAKKDAILATNTSSIPLDEINSAMQNPERLVGIHFFNPVAKMQLVEVVHGEKTSDMVVKNATCFVKAISRLPLPVKSSPGFLVNRVLMPYLMECVALLDEGIPGVEIDKAAVKFGMPMGPVELADTVGLDICLSVANNLTKYYGGTVPEKLQKMVAEGNLGRKTGRGFYIYKNNKAIKPKASGNYDMELITDRLILRLLNESMACLREKIVTDGDLLDGGMIFGTGFAPFRGGPINYACTTGVSTLKDKLNHLQEKYGDRFKPDVEWDKKL